MTGDAHDHTRSRAVSEHALHAALESGIARHSVGSARITRINRKPSPYSTSFTIEELEVFVEGMGLPANTPLRLIFKDLSWSSLIGAARDVRPRFLYDPAREIAMYRDVLPHHDFGTAICYGTHVDAAADHYWLFLEHVAGRKLAHVGEFSHWQEAARWLARLHARLAALAPALSRTLPLIQYDASYYRLWVERVGSRLRESGIPDGLANFTTKFDQIIERLTCSWQTILHGEFYAGNILVQEGGGGPRICPIDWETAAMGPALMDLSALASGNWDTAHQDALIAAYRDELLKQGFASPPLQEFMQTLDCCRFHQALQWLGWARNWTPPPDQATDWLAEFRLLCDRLQL